MIFWLVATIYLLGVIFFIMNLIISNGTPAESRYEQSTWFEYLEFGFKWPYWVWLELKERFLDRDKGERNE